MYYFLPAWYRNNERSFYNVAPPWFREQQKIEFDDTINQIKMFSEATQPVELLIIGYMPNLRSFLQRQELEQISYYSIFDELQDVELKGSRRVELHDLNFPGDVDFSYSPFRVSVYRKQKHYAYIDFGDLGEILAVTLADKRYVFDDRGFLSSIMYFDEIGQPKRQEYLNLAGQIRFTEDLKTGQVTVAKEFEADFKKLRYETLKELVTERLNDFLAKVSADDIFILAAGGNRTKLALETIKQGKIVLSHFTGRDNEIGTLPQETLEKIYLAVADTEKTEQELKTTYPAEKIKLVTPFDTRLRLGHSQQLAEDIVLFLIDELEISVLDQAVEQIVELIKNRKQLVLQIGVLRRGKYELEELRAHLSQLIPEVNFVLSEEKVEESNENEELEAIETPKRTEVELFYIDTENDLIKALDQARLLVDLDEVPDLYAQIVAISAGVPQIILEPDDLVEDKKNGVILNGDVTKLTQAIRFYTDELKHWNQAMMYAVAKINDLTSGSLARRWEKWLDVERKEV